MSISSESTTKAVSDEEIAATSPNAMIRATAGFQIGSGILSALVAVQLLLSVRYNSAAQVIPIALLVLGIIAIPVGASVFRMRLWAAQFGCALSGVVALAQAALLLMNVAGGLVSCLGFIAPPFAVLSFVFSFFAIRPCARATEIRARMHAQGLDLGN